MFRLPEHTTCRGRCHMMLLGLHCVRWEGTVRRACEQILQPHTVCLPTVQPLRVVQPDAVCEVGGSTPGLSHGDLGIFLGGGQTEEFVH